MRTHYGPWQPCWISNQHQKHKSGRGPSSEHFWQVWLISVQRFQRRRLVGALDNYSLVFVIFINFFGQLRLSRTSTFLAHLAIGHVSFCHG
jgi:hypothetical protein